VHGHRDFFGGTTKKLPWAPSRVPLRWFRVFSGEPHSDVLLNGRDVRESPQSQFFAEGRHIPISRIHDDRSLRNSQLAAVRRSRRAQFPTSFGTSPHPERRPCVVDPDPTPNPPEGTADSAPEGSAICSRPRPKPPPGSCPVSLRSRSTGAQPRPSACPSSGYRCRRGSKLESRRVPQTAEAPMRTRHRARHRHPKGPSTRSGASTDVEPRRSADRPWPPSALHSSARRGAEDLEGKPGEAPGGLHGPMPASDSPNTTRGALVISSIRLYSPPPKLDRSRSIEQIL